MIPYPIQTYTYKGYPYIFNKYGQTEFTMYQGSQEIFFATKYDVQYYIDVYLLHGIAYEHENNI